MRTTPTAPFAPVELRSPARGATIILTADRSVLTPEGGSRLVEKGRIVKFNEGVAIITDPEDYALLQNHPAYTGDGEPRIAFEISENAVMPSGPDGPRIITGAVSSSSGARPAEPIPGYDQLQYAQLRKAVMDDKFPDPVGAIVYERSFRNRQGVLELFAAAITGASKLPTARAMEKADLENSLASLGPDDETPPETDTDPVPAPEPLAADSEDATAMALELARLEAEPLDPGFSEPVPGEGVL